MLSLTHTLSLSLSLSPPTHDPVSLYYPITSHTNREQYCALFQISHVVSRDGLTKI